MVEACFLSPPQTSLCSLLIALLIVWSSRCQPLPYFLHYPFKHQQSHDTGFFSLILIIPLVESSLRFFFPHSAWCGPPTAVAALQSNESSANLARYLLSCDEPHETVSAREWMYVLISAGSVMCAALCQSQAINLSVRWWEVSRWEGRRAASHHEKDALCF